MNHTRRVAIIGECMVELKKVNGALQQGFGAEGSPHFSPKLCRTYRFEASYG